MTTTQHKVSAIIPAPHYVLAGAPIYNFDFTSWTANLPTGWTVIAGATVARGYNEQTGKVDARLTANGGALQHIQPITLGTPYRLTLVVRNMSLTPLTPTVLIVTNQGGPYPALMPGETRTITADYTAVVGSAAIKVGTVEAGVLALGQATLTPITLEKYLDLNPTDLSLTLDESWTPYVQARLTCPMPPPDALALIDPRGRLRVNLALTRSGAEAMLVRDLTSMLHVSFDSTYNLAYTPRSNNWTKVAGGKTWATSPLTGPGINPPNGVEGGTRFIQADTADSAAGEAFQHALQADLGAGLSYLISLYVRSSVVTRVQASVPGVPGSVSVITPVRTSVWNRIVLPFNLSTSAPGATIRLTVLDPVPLGSVIDLTQTQVEQTRPDTRGTNLDGANPSFEKPLSGSANGGSAVNTLDSTWADQGVNSLKSVAGTNASSFYPYGAATSAHMMADLGMEYGKTYTVSATCRVLTPQNTAGISASARRIVVNTTTGGVLSATLAQSSQAPNVAGTYRLKATFTIPAGVGDTVVRLYNGSATAGDALWWDSLMVEEGVTAGVWSDGWVGGSPAQTEPSIYLDGGLGRVGDPPGFPIWTGAEFNSPSAKVYGASKVSDFTRILGGSVIRTNLCTNPSFETGTTGWTATNATLTNPTTGGYSGARHLRATGTGASPMVRGPFAVAAPGQRYTVSAYVRGTAGRAVRMYVDQYANNNGTGAVTTTSSSAITLTGAWQRVSLMVTQEAGKQSFRYGPGGALMSTGDVLDVDAVLPEFGGAIGSYFDGSTAAAGTTTYAWSGTANASTSTAVTTQAQKFVWYLSDLFGDQFNPVLDVALNQSRSFDLSLQERTLDHVAGTMSLLLTSDEMALQDLGRVDLADPVTTPPSTTSLKTLVSWALNLIGATLMPGASDAALVAADVQWSQGDTLWDFLDGFVGAAGLRLICDEQRRWYLRAQAPGAGGVAVINALVGVDDTLTRRGWSDSLVLINQWTDPSVGTVTRTSAGTASADGAGYTKTRIVPKTSKTPATVAGAQQVFPRVGTLGRLLGVTAVSDYSVTPGQLTTISTPTLAIGSAFIKSVTWDLPGDEMTIETRDQAVK